MSQTEAEDHFRKCHRMAPFCFYNGNTFAPISQSMVGKLELPATEAAALPSLPVHIVAGVATPKPIESFRKFLRA